MFKRAFIIFFSGLLFFGVAYAYLYHNFNQSAAEADQKDYTVPYEKVPQNCGITFVFPNNSAVLAYLNFDDLSIKLFDIENFDSTRPEYNGYTADYTVQTDYELVEGIIDRVGGVNLDYGGEKLRYTGIQVVDIISRGCDNNLKRQLISEIFDRISKNNFSKDDFVYIIENSESNLSVIDCIYWLDYIKQMSGRISFAN